jgi:glutamyl-tRNA reductase
MTTDPAASRDAWPGLAVVGIDHRTAPPALRDGLFLTDEDLDALQATLRGRGLEQVVVLSTCDRLEFHVVAADVSTAATLAGAVIADLAAARGLGGAVRPVARFGATALDHLFRVACALESRVAGEPQILGQVKAADRRAREAGLMGAELDAVLSAAYAAAKRVRSETTIGERPTSMAAAALAVARDVHGDLSRISLLVLGGGELGEIMLDLLRGAGVRRARLADPYPSRATFLSRRLGLPLAPFETLADTLVDCDVVVAAAGTGRVLLGRSEMERVAQLRRRRPVLLLDFGVPPDADPGVDDVDGVYRYDIDDLERIALQGRAGREAELAAADAIVAQEIARFRAARSWRAAVPIIASLRRRFDAERHRALDEAGADAARATELMANRLLHLPQAHLRGLAAPDADPDAMRAAEDLLRALFGLDDGTPSA